MCVCVLDIWMICFYAERCFESLTCWVYFWLSCLLVAFISVFFPLEILIFFKLDIFSIDPRQFPFLSSFLSLALIETSTDLRSIKEFSCALCLLDRISTDLQSIDISGSLLNRSSTVSRSNENFRFHLHKSSTSSLIHRAKFLCSLFAQ